MNGPSASEIVFLSVNHSITLMGKVWLIVMILLRILVLLLAGYPLYQDEQERFVCNTIQPGCVNVCYDLFAPVSPLRFWLVQLAILCLPYATFVCYVVHQVSSDLRADLDAPSRRTPTPAAAAERWRGGFAGAYVLHLLLRILLEAGFGAAHYYQFGFSVPRRFLCQQPPCTTLVDCYVSRPTEKTAMLHFMQAVAALSLLLNALDLVCAVRRSVRQKSGRKMVVRKIYDEEERYFLAAAADSPAVDTRTPLGHQDLGGEGAHAGNFRKRVGSKGSSVGGGALGFAQGPPCLKLSVPGSPVSLPSGAPDPNSNGNNGYSAAHEEPPEAGGSETALCPPEPSVTPRSIRVSKRSRLKPPPPPRRDPALSLGGAVGSVRDIAAATAVCTRRVGQYTLVELTSGVELQDNNDGHEKRSEWV